MKQQHDRCTRRAGLTIENVQAIDRACPVIGHGYAGRGAATERGSRCEVVIVILLA